MTDDELYALRLKLVTTHMRSAFKDCKPDRREQLLRDVQDVLDEIMCSIDYRAESNRGD